MPKTYKDYCHTAKNDSLKSSLPVLVKRPANSPFFKPLIQPKLTIGATDDPYEHEANVLADEIMGMKTNETEPAPSQSSLHTASMVQRMCTRCEEEKKKKVQMKAGSTAEGNVTAPSAVHDVIGSSGQPLAAGTRNFMESRFERDFSKVEIHNDSLAHQSSDDINALAYTHGNHIIFGDGQYQPSTDKGKKLIAHELAHVIQQGNDNTVRRQPKDKKEDDLEGLVRSSFILVKGHGNRGNSPGDTGIAYEGKAEKLGDMYRENKVCWEGDYVGVNIYFSTSPNSSDATPPRQIPPFVSAKLKYKEAEALLSYRYEGSDAKPVWYSGPAVDPSPYWYPNMQTFFVYPLNKRATLDIHLEMMDIEEDALQVYDDQIDFVKCGIVEKCYKDAVATDRWAVIPADGSPIHAASKKEHDNGPRYEIYKENGKESYFICLDETTRHPVTREGDEP